MSFERTLKKSEYDVQAIPLEGIAVARYQAGLRTEARIVDATRSLLAEGGLEAATLKAICEEAGVKAGSFYNLFDSKEEVVIRVVRESIDAVDPDPGGAGTDTVDDLVAAFIRFFVEQPEMAKVYVIAAVNTETSDNGARRRFLRHHLRRVERFADAMMRQDRSLTSDTATMRAEILLGALDGLAFRWTIDSTFEFEKFALEAASRLS
ncbi:MAG: TetR/AcrR family transcriptional regulator [Acidimicrobiia bacterium]|nr:TetR/AcrR family transcriptional regulator [Acidimicrobiia bacterium]